MRKHYIGLTLYWIITGILPALLLYPALMYLDLSGMGGYDGIASVTMMEQHGSWSSAKGHTFVYYAFTTVFLLWCLTLLNLPLAIVFAVIRHGQK